MGRGFDETDQETGEDKVNWWRWEFREMMLDAG